MSDISAGGRHGMQAVIGDGHAEMRRITELYQKADRQAADQFSSFCAEGHWKAAITLAVQVVGISEAELAQALAVSRSAVNRWLSVGSRPLPSAMAYIETGIRGLILARHGQETDAEDGQHIAETWTQEHEALYDEAMRLFGARCLWSTKPARSESGLRSMAAHLQENGGMDAWRYAGRILEAVGNAAR